MLTRARVLAVGALLVGVIGSYVWLHSGNDHKSTHHAAKIVVAPDASLTRALAYVSSSSPVVGVIQTDQRRIAMQSAIGLASRLPGADEAFSTVENFVQSHSGLDLATDLPLLVGNPIVFGAGRPHQTIAAWVTNSESALQDALTAGTDAGDLTAGGTYRSTQLYSGPDGTAVAVAGPVVIFGSNPQAIRDAIDRQSAGTGALSARGFDKRSAGVPQTALVRVVASGSGLRSVLASLYPPAGQVPWVAALSGGALGLTAGDDGLHATLTLNSTPGVLTPDDMPFAAGAVAPILRGQAGVTIGVRDLAHLGHFLLAAGQATDAPLVADYQKVDDLLTRFVHIDLDQEILSTLTGSATITTDDLHNFSLRAQTSDPNAVGDVLARVAGVGRIGGILGVDLGGYGISSDDSGLVTITKDDAPVVTLGVRNGVFVASTDPDADFDAIAEAPERDDGAPAPRGALRIRVAAKVLLDALVDRAGLPATTRVLLEPLRESIITGQVTGGDLTLRFFLPIAD